MWNLLLFKRERSSWDFFFFLSVIYQDWWGGDNDDTDFVFIQDITRKTTALRVLWVKACNCTGPEFQQEMNWHFLSQLMKDNWGLLKNEQWMINSFIWCQRSSLHLLVMSWQFPLFGKPVLNTQAGRTENRSHCTRGFCYCCCWFSFSRLKADAAAWKPCLQAKATIPSHIITRLFLSNSVARNLESLKLGNWTW